MAVTIAVESPLQDEVRTLIAELNTVLLALSPPEACSVRRCAIFRLWGVWPGGAAQCPWKPWCSCSPM